MRDWRKWDRIPLSASSFGLFICRPSVELMIFDFELDGRTYSVNSADATSIAIQLDFDGPQPVHFGVAPASRRPLRSGGFIGRTALGGGCNVDMIEIIPHCNGTHTESVGHIVNEQVPISDLLIECWLAATLISLSPINVAQCTETYRPSFGESDRVLTKPSIVEALERLPSCRTESLIIRSLPNDPDKRKRDYSIADSQLFFTIEAIRHIREMDIKHLLVDLPSIDRTDDGGLLTNHHMFWNVTENSHELNPNSHVDRTITEMVFVPDSLKDGRYLLNLQVAPFCSDAAPSRPILFPIVEP